MKRSAPLPRRATLRRTGRLRPLSLKRRIGFEAWREVYAQVDQRSGGWCELDDHGRHRAREHHHLRKPRASYHDPRLILHVCRAGHREFDRPYVQGRRVPTVFDPILGRYRTAVVTAADKWAHHAVGA